MAEARGEFRCFIDADNGVSFEQIDGAFELSDRYDIVIGSRYMEGGEHGKRALSKTIMSRGGNLLFKLILGLDYTDTRAPMSCTGHTPRRISFPGSGWRASASTRSSSSCKALWAQRQRVPGELGGRTRIDDSVQT